MNDLDKNITNLYKSVIHEIRRIRNIAIEDVNNYDKVDFDHLVNLFFYLEEEIDVQAQYFDIDWDEINSGL